MNLDELNTLFASAWSQEEKALMFEGLVRGSNGTIAPESAPGALKDANALGLKWRAEAEEFLRKAEDGGKKSAASRALRFGTSQPTSGKSRTPFDESSNQATSYKLQADKEQLSLAPLAGDVSGGATKQQPEKATKKAALAQAQAIYDIYPLKVGRGVAIPKIELAIKDCGFDQLLEATKAYAAATRTWTEQDQKFIPHPSTWYHQQRYRDDQREWTRKSVVPVINLQPGARFGSFGHRE